MTYSNRFTIETPSLSARDGVNGHDVNRHSLDNPLDSPVWQQASDIVNGRSGYSDGSELIPAEVASRAEREGSIPPNAPPADANRDRDHLQTTHGYTVDQEGLVNNYPVTPPVYEQSKQRFGFTAFAERMNGRAAMIGFSLVIILELLTGKGFLALISGQWI